MGSIGAFAEGNSSENINELNEKDVIIRDYKEALLDLKVNSGTGIVAYSNDSTSVSEIQADTVLTLNEAGYESYDVNPQTFENIEAVLDANLENAGLNPEYSYIVLIEGENDNSVVSPFSTVSSSFAHT